MDSKKIVFLAHSTGTNVYNQGNIPEWFSQYNSENGTGYAIKLRAFPKARIYGWKNYPFDYWNIWVKHKGYKLEPSLQSLARKNDMVIWKHCYPGSKVLEDLAGVTIENEIKSLAAYKMQYEALKREMHKYRDTKFLVWTLAVMREEDLTEDQAKRAREFVNWVKEEWDEPGDNIHIWDFYSYQTTSEDGKDQSLYLRPEYATHDPHPNEAFNKRVAPFFSERIVEVLQGGE